MAGTTKGGLKRVSTYLTPEEHARLIRRAQEAGRTHSSEARIAMMRGLREVEAKRSA